MSKKRAALKAVIEDMITHKMDLIHGQETIKVFLEDKDCKFSPDEIEDEKKCLYAYEYAAKMLDEILINVSKTPIGNKLIDEIGYWNPG